MEVTLMNRFIFNPHQKRYCHYSIHHCADKMNSEQWNKIRDRKSSKIQSDKILLQTTITMSFLAINFTLKLLSLIWSINDFFFPLDKFLQFYRHRFCILLPNVSSFDGEQTSGIHISPTTNVIIYQTLNP